MSLQSLILTMGLGLRWWLGGWLGSGCDCGADHIRLRQRRVTTNVVLVLGAIVRRT